MNIGIIVYRNTNLTVLSPLIKELEENNPKVLLLVKQDKKLYYIYKIFRFLKLINKRKDYEYNTSKKYIQNNKLGNIKIVNYSNQKSLIKIMKNNKIKNLVSVEPYYSYFNENYNFFNFYLIEWGLDTYLYELFYNINKVNKEVKICDYILASTINYQNIGIKQLKDFSNKLSISIKNHNIEKLKNKSIYIGSIWNKINFSQNELVNIKKKLSIHGNEKYIYFQPIGEGRKDDLEDDLLEKFDNYIKKQQLKLLKKIFGYCLEKNYKLIIKIRSKEKLNKYYKLYSHYIFENDKGIINLTNALISLSDICITNKSNSLHSIIIKNKKFVIYDFIEKKMVNKKYDKRYVEYFGELYYNKYINEPVMPDKIIEALRKISKKDYINDNKGFVKNFYLNKFNTDIYSEIKKRNTSNE